jgi:hypothetical protein
MPRKPGIVRRPQFSLKKWYEEQGTSRAEMRKTARLLAKRREGGQAKIEADKALAEIEAAFIKRNAGKAAHGSQS